MFHNFLISRFGHAVVADNHMIVRQEFYPASFTPHPTHPLSLPDRWSVAVLATITHKGYYNNSAQHYFETEPTESDILAVLPKLCRSVDRQMAAQRRV